MFQELLHIRHDYYHMIFLGKETTMEHAAENTLKFRFDNVVK